LLAHLRTQGIQAAFHYIPLHSSPMGRSLGYAPADLPRTEALSAALLRMPLFHQITEDQQARVADEVAAFLRRQPPSASPCWQIASERG
jgi:dTDP-4-amino-4,6-dideoxygalactose transaminase